MAELTVPVSEAPAALSQSRSPRRQAMKITGTEQEMLQSVVRKHIIRRRWYGLLNIILLRLRQQKMVRQRIRTEEENRVASFLQAFVRSWLIRRKWRLLIKSTLQDSRKRKPPAPAPPPPVYQFGQPDTEATIVIGKEPDPATGQAVKQVKYATPEKAVEYLTLPFEHCPGFNSIMLHTYPMFMSSADLLSLLSLRFQQTQDIAIRAQTVEMMKHWVEVNMDWNIETAFAAFVEANKDTNTALRGKGSMKVLKNSFELHRKRWHSLKDPLPIESISVQDTPKPLCHKTSPSARLEQVDALEIARQMALLDEEYYRALRVREFLNMAWCKAGKEVHAPKLLAIISRFNELSCWAAFQVLKAETVPERVTMLAHLVKVAKHCRTLRNYNGLMALISGLTGTNVGRLKQTWAAASADTMKDLEELRNLMKLSGNYQGYRTELQELPPSVPCQPFLAPFLSDLTFIDENPRHVNGLVNFIKCRLVHQVVATLLRFRDNTYNLEPVPWLQARILETGMPLTEDGLYQLSLKREPRQGTAQALAPAEGNDLSISQKMSNFFGRGGPEKRSTGRAAVPQRVTTSEQREGSPGPEKRATTKSDAALMSSTVDFAKLAAAKKEMEKKEAERKAEAEKKVAAGRKDEPEKRSSTRRESTTAPTAQAPTDLHSIMDPTSNPQHAVIMHRKGAVANIKPPALLVGSSGDLSVSPGRAGGPPSPNVDKEALKEERKETGPAEKPEHSEHSEHHSKSEEKKEGHSPAKEETHPEGKKEKKEKKKKDQEHKTAEAKVEEKKDEQKPVEQPAAPERKQSDASAIVKAEPTEETKKTKKEKKDKKEKKEKKRKEAEAAAAAVAAKTEAAQPTEQPAPAVQP